MYANLLLVAVSLLCVFHKSLENCISLKTDCLMFECSDHQDVYGHMQMLVQYQQ